MLQNKNQNIKLNQEMKLKLFGQIAENYNKLNMQLSIYMDFQHQKQKEIPFIIT